MIHFIFNTVVAIVVYIMNSNILIQYSDNS